MDNLLRLMYILGKKFEDEITIRQLSVESKVPYTTAHRLIKNNEGLFVIKQKGNLKLCSLNFNDIITKNYLVLAERNESKRFLKKHPDFSTLKDDMPKEDFSLILFGSRAEEKNRDKSDVDVCVINKDGNKKVTFSKFEILFKLEVNPLYFSSKEFRHMLLDKDHNLAKEIIKNHIILHGEEYFWNLVFENGI
ncbi:nucleotidyltransferase domain-containing protein [Candidatus Woesearchaeota archaeon]|nr:nucleotidyltransferase domain-containing protein [Candidatus Woesearchaeota archaeon]